MKIQLICSLQKPNVADLELRIKEEQELRQVCETKLRAAVRNIVSSSGSVRVASTYCVS